jgi:hypothetical protein
MTFRNLQLIARTQRQKFATCFEKKCATASTLPGQFDPQAAFPDLV